MRRRTFLTAPAALAAPARRPNIVLIYADDLGYGDLGCYGSRIPTPNLDRLAAAGMKFTQFTTPSPICAPSRAALITGRYAQRVDVPKNFGGKSTNGMSLADTTLAESLKRAGYRTMCVGKWHLGHARPYLPTSRGFDGYFGIPYSNDMNPPCLMRDTQVIEPRADMNSLSQRYAAEAVKFVESARGGPFFLYHPHTFPHIPLGVSERFRGKSRLGLYGDVLAEMDWGIGEILSALRRHGLEENTLVLFASDNGPWYQGHPGPLRNRKGTTYEGGVRVPLLARWPGRIPAGRVSAAAASTLDLFPTIAKLCGGSKTANPLDGADIWPVLSGASNRIERDLLLYFMDWNAQCARRGKWKLHLSRYNIIRYAVEPRPTPVNLPLPAPELYDMENDPGESYDVAPEHPDVVKEMTASFERLVATFPEPVRQAYAETRVRKPAPTAVGSPPRPAGVPRKAADGES